MAYKQSKISTFFQKQEIKCTPPARKKCRKSLEEITARDLNHNSTPKNSCNSPKGGYSASKFAEETETIVHCFVSRNVHLMKLGANNSCNGSDIEMISDTPDGMPTPDTGIVCPEPELPPGEMLA